MARVAVGTYTGNTAAQNISLGFTPTYVKVWNATDGDTSWEWFSGLGAGDALKSINHADTQFSLLTSNGIDAYAGSSSASKGFTVGTDLAENAKVFRYIAIAEDDVTAV